MSSVIGLSVAAHMAPAGAMIITAWIMVFSTAMGILVIIGAALGARGRWVQV